MKATKPSKKTTSTAKKETKAKTSTKAKTTAKKTTTKKVKEEVPLLDIEATSTLTSTPPPPITPVAVPNPYDGDEEPINEELLAFLAEKLRKDVSLIQPKTNFRKDLQADSLDLVEMVLFMEEKFKLQVHDDDLRHLATPLTVQNYLKSKGVYQ